MLTLKDGRGECRCCLLSLIVISERYAARRGHGVAGIVMSEELARRFRRYIGLGLH